MSIQGSINQALGTAAVAKKMFTPEKTGVASHMNEPYKAQVHDAAKMQQANAQAQSNVSTQKQQKEEFKKLQEQIKNYPTSLGPLKNLDPKIQQQIVAQDKNLQDLLKKSKGVTNE